MDLTQLYNDPATQMLAGRNGLSVQDYVSQMDPRAIQANMANIMRRNSGPALFTNQGQYDNMLATGANSPLAYAPEQGNPVNEGMLFNPTMGQPPQADAPPQMPTAISGGPTQREAPILAQPPVVGQPTAPQAAPILSASGQGATQGALSNSGAGAAVVSRPNSGPSSGSRQTPTNNTANARNSGMPDMRIGRSEGLGRIGTAMLGGNKTGLMDAMAAGGNAMYATSDANRQADLAEYENSERIRLEKVKEAQAAAALAARGGGGKSGGGSGGIAGGGIYQRATLTALDAIQGYIDRDNGSNNPFLNINGWTGSWLSARAGTPAHNVAGLLETVEGAIGFDRLDAMRKASKTGGALGSISERELALLSSSLASLRQSATAEEFQRNITLVRNHYQSSVAALDALMAADAGQTPAASAASGGGSTAAPSAFNPSDYTIEEID